MKPMMKSVRQQTFMARQKKLAKVMQQDNGRRQAEMWLTNMLTRIDLRLAVESEGVVVSYRHAINSVVLQHDGTMVVFTYSDNVPNITIPQTQGSALTASSKLRKRHHSLA